MFAYKKEEENVKLNIGFGEKKISFRIKPLNTNTYMIFLKLERDEISYNNETLSVIYV